jgi:hypothetical protein
VPCRWEWGIGTPSCSIRDPRGERGDDRLDGLNHDDTATPRNAVPELSGGRVSRANFASRLRAVASALLPRRGLAQRSNTFTTKADANAWLAREQADRSRGAWVDPKSGKETLEAYATRWLDGRSDLRETTRAKYGDLLRRHILPVLGRKELAHLEPADIRAWYHRFAKDHQATADDCYRILRAVLNTAVADGHLAKSPCTVKGAGSVRAEERPVASVVEVARVAAEMPE